MARIAFAWELGGELGHGMACAALARALRARGHECAFAFRDLNKLDALDLGDAPVYQGPVSPHEGQGVGVPVCWADLLLGCGYGAADALQGLVAGWIEVLRACRADLLVADYAPTALLAARILGVMRVDYGNGFAIPPRLAPVPPFRMDARIEPAQLAQREAHALASVNAVLSRWKVPALRALHEQLEVNESFLCTFPELDHYGGRPRTAYWGPRYSIDKGDDIAWPYGEGPRVLVYLRASDPRIDTVIDLLVQHRCRVAAYIPGLDAERRARLQSAQRRVSERPMRLAPLLGECDLFLDHGGDVAGAGLMHGVPQLLFPAQYEQFLTAVRIEQLGAGVGLARPDPGGEVRAAFGRMLADRARHRAAAQAYRQRYASFSSAEQERRIVARIEQLVQEKTA
ncbi:MAG TPA: nucleotide disphospho-sugar-binding domain-containing protein [Usitatibacter sp.]|jgi:UDP:flavonoid glycosyltransferase YjiC (YdhE family)|nr:nucleotide disphospho-sugar-binding domain-containing protein [Usitatibacter sp.]